MFMMTEYLMIYPPSVLTVKTNMWKSAHFNSFIVYHAY